MYYQVIGCVDIQNRVWLVDGRGVYIIVYTGK